MDLDAKFVHKVTFIPYRRWLPPSRPCRLSSTMIDLISSPVEAKSDAPAVSSGTSDAECRRMVRAHQALQRATAIVLELDAAAKTACLAVHPTSEDWAAALLVVTYDTFKSVEINPSLKVMIFRGLSIESNIYIACVKHTNPLWMLQYISTQ